MNFSYTEIPQIFISYVREDTKEVKKIYTLINKMGYKPWMDTKEVLGGEEWWGFILKNIDESQLFISCISKCSLLKAGYFWRELDYARFQQAGKPPGDQFILPVLLEPVSISVSDPRDLFNRLNYIYWYENNGHKKLKMTIEENLRKKAVREAELFAVLKERQNK